MMCFPEEDSVTLLKGSLTWACTFHLPKSEPSPESFVLWQLWIRVWRSPQWKENMVWERINISPLIIAAVTWMLVEMLVECSQSQQVAVSHRPLEESSATESRRLRLDRVLTLLFTFMYKSWNWYTASSENIGASPAHLFLLYTEFGITIEILYYRWNFRILKVYIHSSVSSQWLWTEFV